MKANRLYAVYVAYRGTTYKKALRQGSYSECLRWRDEQPKPGQGQRLVVAPTYLMNR